MMRLDDDSSSSKIRRRSLLEQYYLILHVLKHKRLKMYEITRLVNMNYYQLQRRIYELNKKNCIHVTDQTAEITITDNGRKLKEQLENLLVIVNKSIV